MDRVLEDLGATRSFDDDVEAVLVICLQGLELLLGVRAAEFDVGVGGVEFLSELHLEAGRGGDHDVAATIVTEKLRENESSGSSAEHQHGRAHLGCDFLETVRSARGWFEERGVNVGQVLDREHFGGGVGTVLGEASVHGDAVGFEFFAEKKLAATTVETLHAELGIVGNDSLANVETLDGWADGCDDADGLMAGDQREFGKELALVDVEILSPSVSI